MLVPGERPWVISFRNNINKVGPTIEPWGTPEFTLLAEDILLPITTL
jgi:hypothetical protein